MVAKPRGTWVAAGLLCLCARVHEARHISMASEVYHPGHRAQHVTRLHRFDRSGEAAMLEAEARWHAESELPAPLGGQQPLQQEEPRSFVSLSSVQVRGLKEHHLQAANDSGLVQLSASSAHYASEGFSGQLRGRHSGSLVIHAAQARPQGGLEYAATRLKSLGSQYVGPISIGTVVAPAGCASESSQSLIYIQRSGAGANSSSFAQSCHTEEQATEMVVLDTGSTNIWVGSMLCKHGPCTKRVRYDSSRSTTYRRPDAGHMLHIQFGTGKISGPQGEDDLHVGPFTVYNQTFGLIQEQEGEVFDQVPFDGILGLAFPKMSANGVTPFFDNIIKQKVLKRNEFAFYFSPDNPSANAVLWGGVDSAFHSGPIEYFKVIDPYYWALKLQSFQIGGTELLGISKAESSFIERGKIPMPKAIVDTGTTFFTAESNVFREVMQRLKAAPCKSMTDKSHPDILFRLENVAGEARDFRLSHSDYMASSGDGPEAECSPAFMEINIPKQHGPGMILGEVFLRQYFSVYDRSDGAPESARVGFARASHGEATNSRLKSLTGQQPAFRPSAAHAARQPAPKAATGR